MNTVPEQALPVLRVQRRVASWYAISAAWLCAAALTVGFARQNWRLVSFIRANDEASSIADRSDDGHKLRVVVNLTAPPDFVAALPGVVDPDAAIRFTSRLAQDQGVRLSQLQSQSIATDAKRLGQAKFTLQLRGDYVNIKNVMIGLLAKFPGLTLQRLTLHHRDAAPRDPVDKGQDEATLELIQFLHPAASS